MDCLTATLVALCLQLPDLGNNPPPRRGETQFTEWGLREVYRDYKAHKAFWYESAAIGEFQFVGAYGKIPRVSSLFPGKELYIYAERRGYQLYLTDSTASLVKRWEFD